MGARRQGQGALVPSVGWKTERQPPWTAARTHRGVHILILS